MPITIVLPDGAQYVVGALLLPSLLVLGQTIKVTKYRKLAAVKYPQLYAEKAEQDTNPMALKFNCAQRAHQNTLESLPSMYMMTILTALKTPKLAAGLLTGWVIGKALYTKGYLAAPSDRNKHGGILGSIAQFVLLLSSIYSVGTLLLSS